MGVVFPLLFGVFLQTVGNHSKVFDLLADPVGKVSLRLLALGDGRTALPLLPVLGQVDNADGVLALLLGLEHSLPLAELAHGMV